MKNLTTYIELAILVAALCFIHSPLIYFKSSSTVLIILIIVVFKSISIHKSRKHEKIDLANSNIITDIEKRLNYEIKRNRPTEPEIEPIFEQELRGVISSIQDHESILNERDQQIVKELKAGKSGVSISKEIGVDPATISRLKKKYL